MNEKNIYNEKELLEDERISLFLQGKMTSDEEESFIDELNKNDDLRERAIIQARLVKGMKQVDEEIKVAFRQTDEKTLRNIAISESGNKKHSVRWFAVAASIIFIVFVGFKSFDYHHTISLGKEYANTFPISSIIRGESNDDIESELTVLFNNISQCKDLDKTISRLSTLWTLSKQETYNDYTDYSPYIGWNLAIGYLEKYEKSKAKDILEEMRKYYPEGTAIGNNVNKLLKECD